MSNPWDDDLIRGDGRAIAHVWEAGLDEAYSRGWQNAVAGIDCADAFAHGADWGAGWLAAIIGMGVAIRERYECYFCPNTATIPGKKPMCRSCWLSGES